MALVDVNGARLEYTEAGRGEPLVFVHGSLEDLRIWRRQVELFSAHYRVDCVQPALSPSQRGARRG